MVDTTGAQPALVGEGAGQTAPTAGQDFWRRYFRVYDTLTESIPYRDLVQRHVDLLAPRPGERILDAGTGTGNVAVALREHGAQVVGFDYCEPALEIARAKAPDLELRFGDLTSTLPFADAAFDKLACCNVIYTLPPEGQRNAVRELYRVLTPGGTAAVTVFGEGFRALAVYFETLRRERQARGLLGAVGRGLRYSFHTARILTYVARIKRQQRHGAYTFYTPQSFRDLLTAGGFEVELVEPIFARQCLIAKAVRPTKGAAAPPPTGAVSASSPDGH
jgi:ubiquinone/menaquinone biosynthesis C-methylase UbiE